MGVPDNGPLIVGITWWLTFFCGGFLGLRLYAKLSRKQGLWWDDYILIASWIFLLIETIITQIGQQLGFGKRTIDIPVQNLLRIAIGTQVASSISCFASTLSKISFGVTLLRLTSGPTRWFVWFCITTLFLIMLPSAFITYIRCTPLEKAWNPSVEGTCWPTRSLVGYGYFNAAWCAAADFALALIPWKLIWGLQLKFREKIGVSIAMSLGILAGVCAIVKGLYLNQLASQDFSYDGKDVSIWTVVETATAIIAASIPILRVFFKEAVSSYASSRGGGGGAAAQSHTRSAKTIHLSRLNRSQTSSHTATVQAIGKDKNGGWTTLEPADEDGSGDGASQRGILRDEEKGLDRRDRGGVVVHEEAGILQTNTVTVTVGSDAERPKDRLWLGA
ncbi:hypothetical protein ACN47E_005247 [Coniothyrium glycines]